MRNNRWINFARLLIKARINVYYTYPFNDTSKECKFYVKLLISFYPRFILLDKYYSLVILLADLNL